MMNDDENPQGSNHACKEISSRSCIQVVYKLLRNRVDERMHKSLGHDSRLGTK